MSNLPLQAAAFAVAAGLAYLAWSQYQQSLAPVDDGGAVDPDPYAYTPPIVTGGIGRDQDVLARTIYGEARGLGRTEMENCAMVIMNRYRLVQQGKGYKSFGGPGVAEICQAPKQFSCWNDGDPNLGVCRQATTADPVFRTAMDIAADALRGRLVDRTGGADHYYATLSTLPAWARGIVSSAHDAGHSFFKLIGG